MSKKRLAINTGGGDAPGLNAVIRAIVLAALRRGWEVSGILRGYQGLLDTDKIVALDADRVRGIAHRGGTILGTINKGNPFQFPRPASEDSSAGVVLVDRSDEVVKNFRRMGFDALIAIGGDGSMRIAHRFAAKGIPVVGVPKTIDNDLEGTLFTFGFHTAVDVATEAIGRLHTTAESHDRVFVVEVMGRYAGWIAIYAGLAGGADVILLPEIPYDVGTVCRKILDREAHGRRFSIVVAAEGATEVDGQRITKGTQEAGREEILGGIAERLAGRIAEGTGKETRSLVLGHLQRGGEPVPFDRLIALRFGAAAVQLVEREEFSRMVVLDPPEVRSIPLDEAVRAMKAVPLDGDIVMTAREMGICLGDEWPS